MPKFNRKELEKKARQEELNRSLNSETGMVKALLKFNDRNRAVSNNLIKVLDKPCEVVVDSKTGEKVLVGNREELKDLFGNYEKSNPKKAPMYGKPFTELGRNPQNHFLMYLISSGLTKEELEGLTKENMDPEFEAKLEEKQKEFYSIIMDKDDKSRTSRCADMYVDYLNNVVGINDARLKAVKEGDHDKAALYSSLIGNVQSYLFQSLTLGFKRQGKMEKVQKGTNDLIDLIDEKTANSPYTLDSIDNALIGLTFYKDIADNLSMVIEKPDEESRKRSVLEQYNVTILPRLKCLNSHAEFMTKEKDAYSKVNDDYATERLVEYAIPIKDEAVRCKTANTIGADYAMDDLLVSLENNKKTTFFGMVKIDNTALYGNVITALKNYKNGEGSIDKVVEACDKYLDDKTPKSTNGQKRYVLIKQVCDYATEKSQVEANKKADKNKENRVATNINKIAEEKGRNSVKAQRTVNPVRNIEVGDVLLRSNTI